MSKKKKSRPKPKKRPPQALRPQPQPEAAVKKKRPAARFILFVGVPAVIVAAAVALFVRPGTRVSVVRDDKLNVLLITLDTTRADRIGAYGYAGAKTPNLDAIARNGVRFQNAYTPVPLTLPSHSSIMTGLYPLTHGVHNNGSYALPADRTTLAKMLKARGYATAAFVASFSVDSRFGLNRSFDVYDDDFQGGSPFKAMNAERKAEQVYALFAPWFDKHREERFFCWLHFFDPHLPYNPPSPYFEQFAGRPYDGEIAYVDYTIGLVMTKLRTYDLLSKTLVVVAGDHGESLGEKGESGHGVFLHDAVLRVPLLFYAEGHLPVERTVVPRVRLIDILPTVCDLLKLDMPAGIQGRSLVPLILNKEKTDRDVYLETFFPRENFGWAPLTGLISGRWKYVRAPKEELYDLSTDPAENANLWTGQPKKAGDLKAALEKFVTDNVVPGAAGKRTLTAEEQARLRSLGYVDFSGKTTGGGGPEPDPKDKVDELKMIQDAERYEYEGNFKAAAELHEKMLALRPSAASSYINLALAQARMKNFEAAVATLELGLKHVPQSELLLSRLGYTYLVTGRTDQAFATMAEVLKINPRHIDALIASAVILDDKGRKDEARGYFEQALAVDPKNKFLRMSYAQNLALAGRIDDAVNVYNRLIQDYPQDPMPFQMLGVTYAMLKDFDKAIENLKQASYLNPPPAVFYYLAISYREKGDIAEAVRWLERYLEDTKGEPPNRVRSAEAGLDALRKLLK